MSTPVRGFRLRSPKSRDEHVDLIAVERACMGDDINLTVPERRLAVTELLGRGLLPREVARRLLISDRSVHRLRKQAAPAISREGCCCSRCLGDREGAAA